MHMALLQSSKVKPQQYERTGELPMLLRDLDVGLSNVTSTVLNAIAKFNIRCHCWWRWRIAGAAAGALLAPGLKVLYR